MTEQEELIRHQNNVYKVLDVATKPAQWFLGGLQVLFLGLFAAGAAIVIPIYLVFTGHAVSDAQLWLAVFALAAIVLFFLCPWYFVCGGITYFAIVSHSIWGHQTTFNTIVGLFLVLGYTQRFVRWVITKYLKEREKRQYEATMTPGISDSEVTILPPARD